MAVIIKRKPFTIGKYSRVITFPKAWTTLKDEVVVCIDRIGLIIPEGATLEDVENDVEKLLRELKKALRNRKEKEEE